jgi:hypothetical protein
LIYFLAKLVARHTRNLPKEAEKFFAIFSGFQNQEGFPSESTKGIPIE